MIRIAPATLSLFAVTALAAPASHDARIETSARNSYAFRIHLQGEPIQITSKDGVVTLRGSVASTYQRSLAEETVTNLPGVRSVNNELTVRGDASMTAQDADLAHRARMALGYHRNLDARFIAVEAKEGKVTLKGETATASQRALAEDIVRELDAVRSVDNRIRIASHEPPGKSASRKVDDASITAQVKGALLFHKGTSALSTRVRTERGSVTIEGDAKDHAEKELVTRVAQRIRGVRQVVNRMTVGQ